MLWFSYGEYSPPLGQSDDYVSNHLLIPSSIYFVALVVLQRFNLLAVRTRRLSLFQHLPLGNKDTNSYLLFSAIVFAFVVNLILVYIERVHSVAGTGNVPVQYWFIPMALGIGMLCLEEARKASIRRWPAGFLAKIAW